MSIPVIDVFAGPGGLNEGFSSIEDESGSAVFEAVASFEMDALACDTLKLRATFRRLRRANFGVTPSTYVQFLMGNLTKEQFYAEPEVREHAEAAAEEVHRVELGEQTRGESDAIIARRLGAAAKSGKFVLIGGPPCQAYSLAGRSRRAGDPTFADDHKHVLYREYLHILGRFRPMVFVMENVKGMLSSKHEGAAIFPRIKADLEYPAGPEDDLAYEIRSFVVPLEAEELEPRDFIIRSEEYGIPQKRHRVILFGVRRDLADRPSKILEKQGLVSVRDALEPLPAVRSRLSPLSQDSEDAWDAVRQETSRRCGGTVTPRIPGLGSAWMNAFPGSVPGELGKWLLDPDVPGVSLHEARRHMRSDLERYGFLAHAAAGGEFLRLADLPADLLPNHANASRPDVPFADRFKVQGWDAPSTTVVSHISKDGHYYIHPDPSQMRSLTVREAARLQTFPDNYFFVGNRTQQYHQVGNAVPPLLARQIGEIVCGFLDR